MNTSTIGMPKIFPVTCHTDFVGHGSTFVAIEGYSDNGVKYIKSAIEKGATQIVVHKDVALDYEIGEYIANRGVIVQRVDDTRSALADLSAQVADFPAKAVNIIGITGTKGKTTTAFLLEQCLRSAGYKTGLISSAGNKIRDIMLPPNLTTPQPDYLHQFLKLCVDNHVEYVVMEVAAQALTLHRVKGIEFDGVIFTNFSHEHLEFYATLSEYFAAKCRIFNMVHPGSPIVLNVDDEFGVQLKNTIPHNSVVGYGFDENAHYKGFYCKTSSSLYVHIQDAHGTVRCECPVLFGRYNSYNILAAGAMAYELGVPSHVLIEAFATFTGVPGRLQQTELPNGARAFIDYAHNPSSFDAVLSTLRALTDDLIVVFGAGGGRDKIKRPVMGEIATRYADLVVLTTDNPRLEKSEEILADIYQGIDEKNTHKVIQELDREKAIQLAYARSQKGSIIAILGKGPDEYQIVGVIKYPFSESAILKQLT